jgi:hypothetical protein
LLGVIGVYHVGLGVLPFLPTSFTTRILLALFGMAFEVTPQLHYLGQLFGIYAFAFGLMALVAARDPYRYRSLVTVIVVLYGLRILNRLAFIVAFMPAFRTSAFRGWLEVVLLAAFGLAVLALRPRGATPQVAESAAG